MTWSDAARRASAEARRRKAGSRTPHQRAAATSERRARAAEKSGNPHVADIIRGNAPSTYQGTPASPYNAAGEHIPYSRSRKK